MEEPDIAAAWAEPAEELARNRVAVLAQGENWAVVYNPSGLTFTPLKVSKGTQLGPAIQQLVPDLSPSRFFGWEGSPKIEYRKKMVPFF